MISQNLRHLRVFLAVAECGSVTQAAARCYVSQPAVTQAVSKLEALAGRPLFERSSQGFFPSDAGIILHRRVSRALRILDTALTDVGPRLVRIATRSQLLALAATCETQNFSLAAREMQLSQPTVHRAVAQLERESPHLLFQRTAIGIAPTRVCRALARATRLAFAELDQADAELGELDGREVGRIVIGTTPLARSHMLPKALRAFRRDRPTQRVKVLDGQYDELLGGLRCGDIDFLVGALRDPVPIDDVVQEAVFNDVLVLLAGNGHPLVGHPRPTLSDLAGFPWLVAREKTPTRSHFDAMFRDCGVAPPSGLIETGSIILMREMVQDAHHLACVSRLQALGEIEAGNVRALTFSVPNSTRAIGLTFRAGWEPTPAQALLLEAMRSVRGS